MKPKVRARDSSRRKLVGIDVDVASTGGRSTDDRTSISTSSRKPLLVREQFADGTVARDADRLQHLDILAPRIERDDAGLIDGGDERVGAAVHDRHFRAVDLDHGVVDAEAASAARTCSAVEHSGPFASPSTVANSVAVTARTSARTSRSHRRCIGALKNNAGIGIGRMQGQCDRRAGMNADAGNRNLIAQRGLPCRKIRRVLAACLLCRHAPHPSEPADTAVRSNRLTKSDARRQC